MTVQIGIEPTLNVTAPIRISDGDYALSRVGLSLYDVFPNGERFLMFRETENTSHLVHVVLNAFQGLK